MAATRKHNNLSLIGEDALYRKVSWRIIPLLLVCFVVAYLDRVNVGFVKQQMERDLGFSDTVYGLGAGIFFIGYFLFEVPSNMILHKFGARRWLGRIMISWGIVSGAMAFAQSEVHFYLLRFLLGVAEAGFFPGIILYLTYWYPAERRARVTSLFMTGMSIAGIVGGPISGWILSVMSGVHGWDGWQWMYVLEGIPSVFLGLLLLRYLDDRISDAGWLSDTEKTLLTERITQDQLGKAQASFRDMLKNPRIWNLAAIYFCLVMGLYGISFWLPSLIEGMGVKDSFEVGLLSAIPWTAAAITMVLTAASADKVRERRWHVVIPALLGALGLGLSVHWAETPSLALLSLTIATMGIATSLPLFWSLPTAFLSGTASAAGIALINSLGNLAGFSSPYAIGWLRDATHSTSTGMYLLIACLVLAASITLTIPARLVNK